MGRILDPLSNSGSIAYVDGLSTSNGAANLALLNGAVTKLGDAGGLIWLRDAPGSYPISDNWIIDGNDVTLYGEGIHLFTSAATTTGGAIQFLGMYLDSGNLGAVSTPQRHRAAVMGTLKFTGWAGSANENALGFTRFKHVYVAPTVEIVAAGNKGITTQYGCDYVTIEAREIGACGVRGISIEAQGGPVKSIVRSPHVVSAGAEAILISGSIVTVDDALVDAAFTSGGSPTTGAIHINAPNGGSLVVGRIRAATVTEANNGKGAVISGATALAHIDTLEVGHSVGNAAEFFNCSGLCFSDGVNAPSSPAGAVVAGTTRSILRRSIDQDALTSGEATMDRNDVNVATVSNASGQVRLAYFRARKTETIGNVRVRCGTTAGATFTLVRVGVWVEDESTGNLTLVASSVNDTTKMNTANTTYTFPLSASFVKQAGKRYAVGVLMVAGSASQMTGNVALAGGDTAEAAQTPRMAGSITGQADIPASITSGSIGATAAKTYCVLTP